jgi:hypothetical protein
LASGLKGAADGGARQPERGIRCAFHVLGQGIALELLEQEVPLARDRIAGPDGSGG